MILCVLMITTRMRLFWKSTRINMCFVILIIAFLFIGSLTLISGVAQNYPDGYAAEATGLVIVVLVALFFAARKN